MKRRRFFGALAAIGTMLLVNRSLALEATEDELQLTALEPGQHKPDPNMLTEEYLYDGNHFVRLPPGWQLTSIKLEELQCRA